MVDSSKPRHIRDIAHLYISRLQNQSRSSRTTILITSGKNSCFSGFHTANLAVTLALKGIITRLFDLSGLFPNAGFFLALPPERYIRWKSGERETVWSGLAGVKIGYSLPELIEPEGAVGSPQIRLVHLPPSSPDLPFQEAIKKVAGQLDSPAFLVLLEREDPRSQGREKSISSLIDRLSPDVVCLLRLENGDSPNHFTDRWFFDLGGLPKWEYALQDRIPAVVRAPNSALSRAYQAVCESLLCKINQSRRMTNATRSLRKSSRVRSG